MRARFLTVLGLGVACGVALGCGSSSNGDVGGSGVSDGGPSADGSVDRDASSSGDDDGGSRVGGGDASDVLDASDGAIVVTSEAGTGTSDQALLDAVQQQTLKYFWDFGHPTSGLARERATSGDTVTTGGTGFGLSAIVTGVARGWISRSDAVTRLTTMTTFLGNADRFHGAFSHWLNGQTGKVIPFSTMDDGGDLVETAYLVEGLLIARAYFDGNDATESALRTSIDTLVNAVEWDWYASKGDGKLYWHWSPDYGFAQGQTIVGYDEALVTYVLAMGASAHAIDPSVYQSTWFGLGYDNGQTYDGYVLPIGPAHGGPLFFTHYSFLGLDPRGMQDSHGWFWQQNVDDVLQNRAYCLNDANGSYGYGAELWGITASDGPSGYGAWSPTNDTGVIAPTAALSSMPYAPYHSLQVLRNLFASLKTQTFQMYGFVDALSPSKGWYDTDFLAIDQGPIVVMIENYRSGLFWSLGGLIPQLQNGLVQAGFQAPALTDGFYLAVPDAVTGQVDLVRHPDRGDYELDVSVASAGTYDLVVEDADSNVVANVWSSQTRTASATTVSLGNASSLPTGNYVVHLTGASLDKRLPVTLH